jgi:hypothetical protein
LAASILRRRKMPIRLLPPLAKNNKQSSAKRIWTRVTQSLNALVEPISGADAKYFRGQSVGGKT